MLDAVIYLTLVLSFGFPVVPWLFGTRWGRKGIWLSAGLVIVILCLFAPLFSSACVAANCGQGAIAIFVLGTIWLISAILTVMSAALAHFKFAR
jgi:hypothetical protein